MLYGWLFVSSSVEHAVNHEPRSITIANTNFISHTSHFLSHRITDEDSLARMPFACAALKLGKTSQKPTAPTAGKPRSFFSPGQAILATDKTQHRQHSPTSSKTRPAEPRALEISSWLGQALAGGSQCAAVPALMVSQVVFCIINTTGTSGAQRVLETCHVIPWHALCSKLKDASLCETCSNQTP